MGENKKEMQSYSQNSTVKKKVLDLTKPIREEAIRKLYEVTFPNTKSLVIADLGCASGPNMLSMVRDLFVTLDGIRRETNHRYWGMEFQVFLNDLPCNNFNTIFRSIPEFKKQLESEMGPEFGSCFVNGVPGSFHDRLFPCESLHFVHSSFGLHWLSQIPKGVVGSNKGNINTGSSSPAESVAKAYYKQFQDDFLRFLRCRLEEMVNGGCMVFTLLGRKSQDPRCNEYGYMWELLGMTLRQMTSEGLIKEDKMNSFNIPVYTPTLAEITTEIAKIDHFTIIRTETCEVSLGDEEEDFFKCNPPRNKVLGKEQNPPSYDKYLSIARSMRAVAEPMIVCHFGHKRLCINEVFRRYEEIVRDCMTYEKSKIFNISVFLAKNIV